MARVDLVRASDLAAALAALVDSSPAALDTLKELATALGNDPNFAASVASQIGAKYTKPGAGIPKADLVAAVQASLGLADTAAQPAAVDAKYTKPGTGIPANDLSAALLNVLGASPLIAGKFYPAFSPQNISTQLVAIGSMRMGRFIVGRTCTLTSIALEITTAGGAGAITRLGIYAFNPATAVASLLLDAGTVDAASTGVKTLTISQPVTLGQTLLLAGVNQGAPSPVPTFRTNAGHDQFWGDSTSVVSATGVIGVAVSGVTDALPATPSLGVAGSGSVPRIMISASA